MTLITKSDPETSLMNALIGYDNLLVSGTAGREAVLTPTTYDRYSPTTTTTNSRYQLATTSTKFDFIGIAAHNFGSSGLITSIKVGYSLTVGGAAIDIDTAIPTDDTPIMFRFDEITAAEIILTIVSTATGVEVGVLYAGLLMEMQRPIFGGNSPINLNANTKYQSVKSESGNILGRSITRQGLSSSFSWQNLDDTWVRETFKPFMIAARTTPFFMLWRPDYYSDEVAYGQTTNDIKVSNQGGGTRLMTASFTMDAHSDI